MMVAAPIASNFSARYIAEQQALTQTKAWHAKLISILDNGDFTFRMGELTPDDRTAMNVFIQLSDSYRYELLDANGQIFASSNASKVGTRLPKSQFGQAVRQGHVQLERVDRLPTEIDNLDVKSTSVLPGQRRPTYSILMPILRQDNFVGAIKHYFDTTQSINHFQHVINIVLFSLTALALVIAGLAIGNIIHFSRKRERLAKDAHARETATIKEEIKRNHESELLSDLNDWLQSSKSLEELYTMVSAFMSKMLPNCPGSIYIYSNSRDTLEGACTWNNGNLVNHIQPDDCWGLGRGRVYNFGDHQIDFTCSHVDETEQDPYCCIPIIAHGETVGLLHLQAPPGESVQTEGPSIETWHERKTLAARAAEQVSLAIANVKLRDQLRDQSIRDPLTGLYNRRYMLEVCRREVARATRNNESFSLLALDINHFKSFNDNHGHDAGDMVLRALGDLLLNEFREEDVACRFGGEEFVLLMTGANADAARMRANELRGLVEEIVVRYSQTRLPRITVSIGIATLPESGASPQELLSAADVALYQAKAQGRNCVVHTVDALAKSDDGQANAQDEVADGAQDEIKMIAAIPTDAHEEIQREPALQAAE